MEDYKEGGDDDAWAAQDDGWGDVQDEDAARAKHAWQWCHMSELDVVQVEWTIMLL